MTGPSDPRREGSIADTGMFRKFVAEAETEPPRSLTWLWWLVGVIVLAVVVVVIVLLLR